MTTTLGSLAEFLTEMKEIKSNSQYLQMIRQSGGENSPALMQGRTRSTFIKKYKKAPPRSLTFERCRANISIFPTEKVQSPAFLSPSDQIRGELM
jgi:hypothetical protein